MIDQDILAPLFERTLSLETRRNDTEPQDSVLPLWQHIADTLDQIAANTHDFLKKNFSIATRTTRNRQANNAGASPQRRHLAHNLTTPNQPVRTAQQRTPRQNTASVDSLQTWQRLLVENEATTQARPQTQSQAALERVAEQRRQAQTEQNQPQGLLTSRFGGIPAQLKDIAKNLATGRKNQDLRDVIGLAIGGPFYEAFKEMSNLTEGLQDTFKKKNTANAEESRDANGHRTRPLRDEHGRFIRRGANTQTAQTATFPTIATNTSQPLQGIVRAIRQPLAELTDNLRQRDNIHNPNQLTASDQRNAESRQEDQLEAEQESVDLARHAVTTENRHHNEVIRAIQANSGESTGILDKFLHRDKRLNGQTTRRNERQTRQIDRQTSSQRQTTRQRRSILDRGRDIVDHGRNVASRAGSSASRAGRGLLGGLGKLGRLASKAILPLTVAMSAFDAFQGWNNRELQQKAFNLKDGQEATTGQKASTALASVIDVGGLTSGLLNMLGMDIDTAAIAKNIYEAGVAISNFVSDTMSKAGESLSSIWEGAKGIGQNIVNLASGALDNISGTLTSVWEGVQGLFGNITDIASNAIDKVSSTFSSLWESAQGLLGGITNLASGALQQLSDTLTSAWESAKNLGKTISNVASNVVDSAKETLSTAVDTAKDTVDNIAEKASEVKDAALDKASSAWEATKDTASKVAKGIKSIFSSEPEEKIEPAQEVQKPDQIKTEESKPVNPAIVENPQQTKLLETKTSAMPAESPLLQKPLLTENQTELEQKSESTSETQAIPTPAPESKLIAPEPVATPGSVKATPTNEPEPILAPVVMEKKPSTPAPAPETEQVAIPEKEQAGAEKENLAESLKDIVEAKPEQESQPPLLQQIKDDKTNSTLIDSLATLNETIAEQNNLLKSQQENQDLFGISGAIGGMANTIAGLRFSGGNRGGNYPNSGSSPASSKGGFAYNPNSKIGDTIAKYESGNKGVDAIGWDRTGGTSYGKWQLSAKAKSMEGWLEMLEKEGGEKAAIAQRIRAAGPLETGSKHGAAVDAYLREARANPELIEESQRQYMLQANYNPAMARIKSDSLKQMIGNDKSLQEMVFSTAVQHGAGGASNIMNKVYKEGMNREDLIKAVYAERATRFRSSTADVQAAARRRMNDESQLILGMSQGEQNVQQMQTRLQGGGSDAIAAGVSSMVAASTQDAMNRNVGYKLSAKNSKTGQIDCSGWVSEMSRQYMDGMNQAMGTKVFSDKAKEALRNGHNREGAAGIVRAVSDYTGELLTNEQLTPDQAREGMVIGLDASASAGSDRFHGIDHVVQTYRDPTTGELMVSESASGSVRGVNTKKGAGVNTSKYADWYAYQQRQGRKMYGADITKMADASKVQAVQPKQNEPESIAQAQTAVSQQEQKEQNQAQNIPSAEVNTAPQAPAQIPAQTQPQTQSVSQTPQAQIPLPPQAPAQIVQTPSTENQSTSENNILPAQNPLPAPIVTQALPSVPNIPTSTNGLFNTALNVASKIPFGQNIMTQASSAMNTAQSALGNFMPNLPSLPSFAKGTLTPSTMPEQVASIAPPSESGTNNMLNTANIENLLQQILQAIQGQTTSQSANKADNLKIDDIPSIGFDFDDTFASALARI